MQPHPQALPNHDQAVVPEGKLRDYVLNPVSERGAHKARLFAAVLGFTRGNAAELAEALLDGLPFVPATPKLADEHGQRFQVDVPVVGPKGAGVVRTGWILRADGGPPTLTTAIVLKEKP